MTNFNSEDLQEYKKEATEELRQEFKDSIRHQNVVDYISDSTPFILSESVNNIAQGEHDWPEEVANIVAEYLAGKQTAVQKSCAVLEIGHLVLNGLHDYAKSMVNMNED